MSEYQELKRFLYYVKDISPRINGAEVNGMITDACEAAYQDTDIAERRHLRREMETLMTNIPGLGKRGALELLAAVGDCMNEKVRSDGQTDYISREKY